jgi:hypothetical protein
MQYQRKVFWCRSAFKEAALSVERVQMRVDAIKHALKGGKHLVGK